MNNGETNIDILLKNMEPKLNDGDFVFCSVIKIPESAIAKIIMSFQEAEGYTIILKKETADAFKLKYSSTMAWITLHIHSSLEAVGLTAAFSKALGDNDISCNVVAGFYHDHIFVGKNDSQKAMRALRELSNL